MSNLEDSKTKLSAAIASFLMLSIALTLVISPVYAVDNTYKTYAYIGVTPNPVGAGQELLVHTGITQQLGSASEGYTGITVTVTKPDGATETLNVAKTDSTGGTGILYVPATVGTYKFQTHFPEQEKVQASFFGPPTTNLYLASDSDIIELVVQADPIAYYPDNPLPSEYWSRPIDSQLRSWSAVSGSWLYVDTNMVAVGNDDAPNTSHILWTTPLLVDGGLAGGALDGAAFYTGDAYEGKWSNSLIVAGKLYYTENPSGLPQLVHCVDLHTGEELWSKIFLNNQTLSFGQIFAWESYNGYGAWSYIWVGAGGGWFGASGSTWTAFDAYTGEWRCTIDGVPRGTLVHDDSTGNFYILQMNSMNGWMALWNFSALFSMEGSFGSAITAKVVNASDNSMAARRAWSWNVSIPVGLPGSIQNVFLNDRVIGASTSSFFGGAGPSQFWAINLKPGQVGQLLFRKSFEVSDANVSLMWSAASQESEVFVCTTKETRRHYGFSSTTGELLYTTESEPYLQMWWGPFFINGGVNIAYGNLYSAAYGGVVFCYDAQTGDLKWSYAAEDPYVEIQWSNNWPLVTLFFTDGKVYVAHNEHSVTYPSYRGAPFFALDAETGDLIFRSDGLFHQSVWGGCAVIGDSIIATQDTYDQKVYAIGKGPSSMTVTAPDAGIAFGSSVMIKGTVMDVSPGTKSTEVALRFANGVPAVSDANQGDWMKYVYKQFTRPAECTGVEVKISVVDSNGNYREIGTTHSSAEGYFSFAWQPDIPGTFFVYAEFAGSEAYYGSDAETSFVVDEAPEPTVAPTPEPASLADQYMLPATGGIIAAIAIVGVVLALLLRKR